MVRGAIVVRQSIKVTYTKISADLLTFCRGSFLNIAYLEVISERAKIVAQSRTVLFLSKEPYNS